MSNSNNEPGEHVVIDRVTQGLRLSHVAVYKEEPATNLVRIKILSGNFVGSHDFYFFKQDLLDFIGCLQRMHDISNGECRLGDSEVDAFIAVKATEGQVTISGRLGSELYDNYLTFKLETDQTELPPLIKALMD